MKYILILMLIVPFASCKNIERQGAPLREDLYGRWYIESVFQDGNDVTDQHNPSDNRWIEFEDDGGFVSDGDPYGRNTGRWMMDLENKELYLDSDAGEGDDSYWIVGFEEGKMQWRGTRSEFTERFVVVYRPG